MSDPFSVRDRVVIVTGASSGLGAQFARALHRSGAQVVAIARRKDRLDELAAECPGLEGRALDVTDDEGCAALVADVLAAHGRVDGLVNNAGMGHPTPAISESLEEFRRVLDVNLTSVFHLARLVAPSMIERRHGSIVNIASIYGLGSTYPIGDASYTSSKAAVVNLTRDLAGQWGKHGVRVNAIAPGFFRSEMAEELFTNDKVHQRITLATPMRRTGEPGELDGALLFLLSDASSFVTGQTIAVDGGWTTH
ncbi:glucose 1-dehydrogenase [Nocardioides sp. BP30]|uniref:SDR family NAD(P)-dependent oxidoreductase n=1 Tax=Nocardioides sp. BP30 TaxID=3036374 RepID=UPI0024699C17|nr:glucose 1-dehydrogenase [Nocardioides sp. BP30]WGL54027.1 glucose 1-dehydrogenase [Nocardioides sp. BP30]